MDGTANYIRKGQLYFNRIQVSESEFKFFNRNKLLGTFAFNHKVRFTKGDTVTLALDEAGGKMKINLV